MMKNLLVILILSILVSSTANAAVKLGVGFDQGFGVTGQFNKINAFVGEDGMSGDYIFMRNTVSKDTPLNWYLAGGAFLGWDHGLGVRLPLGLNMPFSAKWDGYVHVYPELDFDHGHDGDTEFGVDFGIGVRYKF